MSTATRYKYEITAHPSADPKHVVKEVFKKEDSADRWVANLVANGWTVQKTKRVPVTKRVWDDADY